MNCKYETFKLFNTVAKNVSSKLKRNFVPSTVLTPFDYDSAFQQSYAGRKFSAKV